MQTRRTIPMRIARELRRNRYVYLMGPARHRLLSLVLLWPMYGAQIAFRNFTAFKGITGAMGWA